MAEKAGWGLANLEDFFVKEKKTRKKSSLLWVLLNYFIPLPFTMSNTPPPAPKKSVLKLFSFLSFFYTKFSLIDTLHNLFSLRFPSRFMFHFDSCFTFSFHLPLCPFFLLFFLLGFPSLFRLLANLSQNMSNIFPQVHLYSLVWFSSFYLLS